MESPTEADRTADPLGLDVLLEGWKLTRRFFWRGVLFTVIVDTSSFPWMSVELMPNQ